MELDKILYNQIKEYCKLNNLKIGQYINDLVKKAFMEDKYGKVPAFVKSIKSVEEFKAECVNNFSNETEKAEEEFSEIINNVGGVDKFNEVIDECIFGDKEEEESKTSQKIVKTTKRKLNQLSAN